MPKNYVNNQDLTKALGEWATTKRKAIKDGTQPPPMTDYIAEAVRLMTERISKKGNFSGYTYREDLCAEAILSCLKYAHSFDASKSSNAFAYLTSIIHNAIIRSIQLEKKATYITMLASEEFDHPHRQFCRESNQENAGFMKWKAETQKPKAKSKRPTAFEQVVTLHKKGKTMDEIATALGKSMSAVKLNLAKYRNSSLACAAYPATA